MKLLLIAPYPVFPPAAGGKIRIIELARQLCQLGVDVSIATPFHFRQRTALYRHEPVKVRQVMYPFVVPFLLTDRPLPYMYLTSFHPGLTLLARPLLSSYDLYQFEHVSFASLVDEIPPDRPIVYDAHNVERDYVSSECRSAVTTAMVVRRIHRLEDKLLVRASHVFACSAEDRAELARRYGVATSKISIARNGINPAPVPRLAEQRLLEECPWLRPYPRRALFSGSNVAHNRVAVTFIVQQLAPMLRDEYAFVIHGGCGRAVPRDRPENVFVDLDPGCTGFGRLACPGTVALNPVTQGGGTSLKALQYLAYGLPVVSTPFGMRGYPDLRRRVMIAPLHDFVTVLRGLTRPCVLEARVPPEEYTWRSTAVHMKAVYDALLA